MLQADLNEISFACNLKNRILDILQEDTMNSNMNTKSNSYSKMAVPEAREALNRFKYEVANEIGVPLKQGYNGDLTSAQNGSVGGYMVKKMIEAQERQMASGSQNW